MGTSVLLDLEDANVDINSESFEFSYSTIQNENYQNAVFTHKFNIYDQALGGFEGDSNFEPTILPCSFALSCKFYVQKELNGEQFSYDFLEIEEENYQYQIEIYRGTIKIGDVYVNAYAEFDQEWFEEFLNEYLVIV